MFPPLKADRDAGKQRPFALNRQVESSPLQIVRHQIPSTHIACNDTQHPNVELTAWSCLVAREHGCLSFLHPKHVLLSQIVNWVTEPRVNDIAHC